MTAGDLGALQRPPLPLGVWSGEPPRLVPVIWWSIPRAEVLNVARLARQDVERHQRETGARPL